MPLISVIVPVYKVEPYLRQCVDSILAQTFTGFELILVDDGSPDNCGAICDEYAERDSRIHVIHQENGGLSAARNAGIDWAFENSDSKWLTFIDSDDAVSSDFFSCTLTTAEENNAEIVVCDFIRFSSEIPAVTAEIDQPVFLLSGREACFRLYDDDGVKFTIACGKLYRKDLFRDIRYPAGMQHEDEATTYRALYLAEHVAELKSQLYFYRENPQSIMNVKFSTKRFDALKAMRERELFFCGMNDDELARQTAIATDNLQATLILRAKAAGVYNQLPKEKKISARKALAVLRKNCTDDKYTYYLAMVHPNWLRPHAYLRKVKKILHIPCN